MARVPNKTENKLRIACCVLYITQIFFLTENYASYYNQNTNELIDSDSCFFMVYRSIVAGSAQLSIFSIILVLVPVLGFFVFAFDKSRNIKNVYGALSSFLAVFLILNIIGLGNADGDLVTSIGFGAVMAIILYIPIVFLSVMGMFARNLVPNDKNKK